MRATPSHSEKDTACVIVVCKQLLLLDARGGVRIRELCIVSHSTPHNIAEYTMRERGYESDTVYIRYKC